jgi:hypothetical protein
VILKILVVFSLLLSVAAVAMWLRSDAAEDGLLASYHWDYLSVASFRGEIGCELGRKYDGGPADLCTPQMTIGYRRVPARNIPEGDYIHIAEAGGKFKLPHCHDFLGFRWHPRGDREWECQERGVAVPWWFAALVFGAFPAREARRIVLRWRWQSTGHCRSCAYDLTGNISGVCPECGRPTFEGAT